YAFCKPGIRKKHPVQILRRNKLHHEKSHTWHIFQLPRIHRKLLYWWEDCDINRDFKGVFPDILDVKLPISIWIFSLPAPCIVAHLLYTFFRLPVEMCACFFHVCIADGNVSRSALDDFVRDFYSRGFFKSCN